MLWVTCLVHIISSTRIAASEPPLCILMQWTKPSLSVHLIGVHQGYSTLATAQQAHSKPTTTTTRSSDVQKCGDGLARQKREWIDLSGKRLSAVLRTKMGFKFSQRILGVSMAKNT